MDGPTRQSKSIIVPPTFCGGGIINSCKTRSDGSQVPLINDRHTYRWFYVQVSWLSLPWTRMWRNWMKSNELWWKNIQVLLHRKYLFTFTFLSYNNSILIKLFQGQYCFISAQNKNWNLLVFKHTCSNIIKFIIQNNCMA